jgi:hypothetical protein
MDGQCSLDCNCQCHFIDACVESVTTQGEQSGYQAIIDCI